MVYFDTDSVILLVPPGEEPPETSTMLGALKDEIAEDPELGPDAVIVAFASGGPKLYCYV